VRVAENLNAGLHQLLAADPNAYLLGEDIADPYGGAFKVTAGLSSRFPEQVRTMPLSEGTIAGVAAGLALAGDTAVAEIMFGDFAALAFDQIVNFAAKSVSMYGRPVQLRMLVRCPVGGGRGYGPTHSQSPQKHFVGVPDLHLYEMSPFHDARTLLPRILDRAVPAMLFEDKVLYTRPMADSGELDGLFGHDLIGPWPGTARVFVDDPEAYHCVLIAPGGVVHRALAAARTLLLEHEITCLLLVPSRLYPLDLEPLLPIVERAELTGVVEESTAGGTWGAEVAQAIHGRLWSRLRRPVRLIHSADAVIPSARHLESRVLVQESTIVRAVAEALA
jgi:pyruvate/2-oxoglutarate/acetoin dehydrogenase E1 component